MDIKFTFNKAMQCFPHAVPLQSSILAHGTEYFNARVQYVPLQNNSIDIDEVQAPFLSVTSSVHSPPIGLDHNLCIIQRQRCGE